MDTSRQIGMRQKYELTNHNFSANAFFFRFDFQKVDSFWAIT